MLKDGKINIIQHLTPSSMKKTDKNINDTARIFLEPSRNSRVLINATLKIQRKQSFIQR